MTWERLAKHAFVAVVRPRERPKRAWMRSPQGFVSFRRFLSKLLLRKLNVRKILKYSLEHSELCDLQYIGIVSSGVFRFRRALSNEPSANAIAVERAKAGRRKFGRAFTASAYLATQLAITGERWTGR